MKRYLALLTLTSVPGLLCLCTDSTGPSSAAVAEKKTETETDDGILEAAAYQSMKKEMAGSEVEDESLDWVNTEKPKPRVNDEFIARLIRQLGDPEYNKREEATHALEAFGIGARDALYKATSDDDIEIAARASRLVERIEDDLDTLLADYKSYCLPLPPADARLVRYESGSASDSTGRRPLYSIGFLVRAGSNAQPALLLVGMKLSRIHASEKMEFVEPTPELLNTIESFDNFFAHEMHRGMAIALQCQIRGWHALAEKLWITNLDRLNWHRSFEKRPPLSYREAVAYLAWLHSVNQAVEPNTDRSKAAKRMKAVLAAEPTFNTDENRRLLKSLEAALVPSKAESGSVERLIDDLPDMCQYLSLFFDHSEKDPRYTRLSRMGFAAVPDLIKHLDDQRLTRCLRVEVFQDHGPVPPENVCVKHVVSLILQNIAGHDVSKDWLDRKNDYVADKATVKAWWDKARKEGEEAYLLNHVIPADKHAPHLNSLMLEIVKAKYPQLLPKLYKAFKEDPDRFGTLSIMRAIADSSLPDLTKREILLDAARDKDVLRRIGALGLLQKYDSYQFITILLESLESLPPRESHGRSSYHCFEYEYADLVLATDDERAWKLLEKVTKRSDVSLRAAFLSRMSERNSQGRKPKHRLQFLAKFLNDDQEPSGRDLATELMAPILHLPDEPDNKWTREQWENLRNKVRERLKQ